MTTIGETIAATAALRGFDVPTPMTIVHRCECGAKVDHRGDHCGACADGFSLALRRQVLRGAWASLPATWTHAELGDDDDAWKGLSAHPAIAKAADGWRTRHGNLLLCGRTGIGKTTAAVAVARRILRQAEEKPVPPAAMALAAGLRMVSARDLAVCRAQSSLGAMPELERTARDASVLILDEIGFEKGWNDEARAIITDVADWRYCPKGDHGPRITITTAGMSLEELTKRYGAAVLRRLGVERGVVVEVT